MRDSLLSEPDKDCPTLCLLKARRFDPRKEAVNTLRISKSNPANDAGYASRGVRLDILATEIMPVLCSRERWKGLGQGGVKECPKSSQIFCALPLL